MANIKTVVTTSGETRVQFDSHYGYAWVRNIGSGDCYVSDSPDIVAGADGVLSLKAGAIVRLTTKEDAVYVKGATTVEVYAQNFADCPFEKFGGEAGEIVIEPLSVTENGTYTAPTGTDGYSPVSVTVPQTTVQSLSVTQNGTYTAPTGTAYSPVTVDVQEQPWQPLQNGYSNFWFELTDDTLSPWLNFSAKNSDAVIDWGDGSGEVALDTLTPTHTYARAGKYVVKVKGVTGIDILYLNTMTDSAYMNILKNIEFNSEITSTVLYSFRRSVGLEDVVIGENTNIGSYSFQFCANLKTINYSEGANTTVGAATFYNCGSLRYISLPSDITEIIQAAFYNCMSLQTITIPALVTNIGNNAFNGCATLTEIHVLPTVPPTLGTNVFGSIANNYVIYVPVGTGETYKAAAGWSAYADHILEEGQSVTRAMQRKFAKADNSIDGDIMEADSSDIKNER